MFRHLRSILPAAAALALVGPALAQRGVPASLLLFPEYDSTSPALLNLLTVTNSNELAPITVEWVFIREVDCLEFNRTEFLTAGDTLTVISRFFNPSMERGFVYVFAKDSMAGQAVAFDHLIGTSTFVDGLASTSYMLEPLTFLSPMAEGASTDLDADNRRDLDGVEYDQAPDRIQVPRFFGNAPGGFESELILINLTGSVQFDAVVNFLILNDNEELFSAQYQFNCWAKPLLTDISGVFQNAFLQITNHDPAEVVGVPGQESGWFTLDGNVAFSTVETVLDPLILAALVERNNLSSAVQHYGFGLQGNGDLINRSVVVTSVAAEQPGGMLMPAGSIGTSRKTFSPVLRH